MKKVLITGSAGFIGRNLLEGLKKDYLLYAPTHTKLDLLDQSAVYRYLNKNRFDIVIHCATHNDTRNSKKDVKQALANNLRMFFNLVRYNDLFGRMFYIGTGAEFDMEHYIPQMKEGYFDTYIPKHEGSFSKYIISKYTQYLDNVYNLRLFGCFGKYEDWEIRFISNACCKAIFNLDITIQKNIYIDYLYVNDLIKIVRKFIETPNLSYKHYNVCTGSTIDLITLAKKILNISNKKLSIKIKKRGFKKEYGGDNKRMLSAIDSFNFTPIDTAIKELYDWYFVNKHIIKKKYLLIDK